MIAFMQFLCRFLESVRSFFKKTLFFLCVAHFALCLVSFPTPAIYCHHFSKKIVFFRWRRFFMGFTNQVHIGYICKKNEFALTSPNFFRFFSHRVYLQEKSECNTFSWYFSENLHAAHQSHLLSIPLPNINEHREDTAEIILRRTPSMVFIKQPPTGYICNKNPNWPRFSQKKSNFS